MKNILTLALCILTLNLSAAATAVDPEVVLAIARDLDAIVGDTVDEGEWDANIKRDANKFPIEYTCTAKNTHRGPLYICSFTFVITPYNNNFADGNTWEAKCSNLLYFVSLKNGKLSVSNYKDSEQSCLETLNEGP